MKQNQITLIIIGFILVTLMATNPSAEEHKEAIKKEIFKAIESNGNSNSAQQLGEKIGEAFGGIMIDNMVKRVNFILFSFSEIKSNTISAEYKAQTITFGVFGYVILLKEYNKETNDFIETDNLNHSSKYKSDPTKWSGDGINIEKFVKAKFWNFRIYLKMQKFKSINKDISHNGIKNIFLRNIEINYPEIYAFNYGTLQSEKIKFPNGFKHWNIMQNNTLLWYENSVTHQLSIFKNYVVASYDSDSSNLHGILIYNLDNNKFSTYDFYLSSSGNGYLFIKDINKSKKIIKDGVLILEKSTNNINWMDSSVGSSF